MTVIDRRTFLRGAAAVAGAAALRPWRLPLAGAAPGLLPPTGAGAPFDHVVLLMMENRTFDHLLGWVPGANGRQAGLTFADSKGALYPTYELDPDFQGCSYDDPDHSFGGGLTHLNGGRGDGFLKTAAEGDTFPIGYYGEHARPVMGALARNYTVCDNYFCAALGQTFPNRIYQQAGRTDRDTNSFDTSTLPTIWDRLAAAGLEGREYFHDLPTLGLWGTKYASMLRPFDRFVADAVAGDLPAYTLISPAALGEGQGVSNDDHPHGDLRAGDELFSTIYHALRSGPKWSRTVFVINYDEWGGFYDHVIPPRAEADDSVVPGSKFDFHLRGFRVPCLVVSPYAPARVASAGPFDHASVLRMIEWRWGLPPVAARDAAARNLAEVLDLASPPRTDMPSVPVLVGQPRGACSTLSTKGQRPSPVAAPGGGSPGAPSPAAPPPPAGSAGAPPAVAAGGSSNRTLPTTGLDLPIELVGTGLLLGAWSAYHLKRTGSDGPLPLRPTTECGQPILTSTDGE
jgi:phospholipase C